MKKLQKIKYVYSAGKLDKREETEEVRPVIENVADDLIIDGEQEIKRVKDQKAGIQIFYVWEEVKAPKKAEKADKK